jgi:hypothetical protein
VAGRALAPFSWPLYHFPCRITGQKPQLLASTGARAGKVVQGPPDGGSPGREASRPSQELVTAPYGGNVGWLARPFLDAGLKQFDDLGDAGRAQVRTAGGGVDPAQVSLPVELRERVEERGRGRVAVEGGPDIIG